jgi:hypothetical protein
MNKSVKNEIGGKHNFEAEIFSPEIFYVLHVLLGTICTFVSLGKEL